MREWQPILIPLDRGLGQESAQTADGVTFSRAVNVDFGRRGAVRGRPGYVRPSGGYAVAGQVNVSGLAIPNFASKANLAATGYTPQAMCAVADKYSERPCLITNGRTFTQEADGVWVDRYGAASYRVDRVADFTKNLAGGLPASFKTDAVGYDFGPGNEAQRIDLITTAGNRDVTVQSPARGPGSSARAGGYSATVHVPTGTNNLILTTHQVGQRSVTTTTLASDAAAPNGFGSAPIICADFGVNQFFIAYVTTTAHQVKILSVNQAGGISASGSVTYGTGTITNIWLCNSDSTTYVTLAMIDSATTGVKTKVYSSSIIDQAIDVTINPSDTCTQVVCGAAQTSGGIVWVAVVTNQGRLWINSRALTTNAAPVNYFAAAGIYYAVTGSTATYGHGWFLQHQPVVFNGRVLMGLAAVRYWGFGSTTPPTASWFVVDLTDLLVSGTNTGARSTPAMVARGVLDGSHVPWQPTTAVISQAGDRYRFATVDWTQFTAGQSNITAITGLSGVLGLNEVAASAPQVAHEGQTTVIGGSVPRAIANGSAAELGFPFLGFPSAYVTVASSSGGNFTAGSYTMRAVWAWTDEAGQVHRSAPSVAYTLTLTANNQITCSGSMYPLTDKSLVTTVDRGGVTLEFYMAGPNPAATAPLYLIGTVTASGVGGNPINTTGNILGPVDSTQLPLYTSGGVLSNLPVSADGGVVVVGKRCWVSDGEYLYASKLGLDGEPPVWNGDQDSRSGGVAGPLTIILPHGSGRILCLGGVDDKVVALCERGIYAIAGEGPDDTGSNSDYTAPFLVSPLGVAGPRACCSTPDGIFFQAAHQQLGEATVGGIWFIDKTLRISNVSWSVRDAIDTNQAGELAYLPERGLVVFLVPAVPGNPTYVGGASQVAGTQTLTLPYAVVLDLQAKSWAIWTAPPDGLTSIAAVSGALWSVGTDAGGFTALPGTGYDAAGGVNTNFTMEMQTNAVATAGDQLGWSRLRSLRVLGDPATVAHNLVMAYTLDDALKSNALESGSHTFAMPVNQQQTTGWPSDRYAPEWRVARKGSTVVVDLQATPAVATWTHLELQVKAERRAPGHFRA